MLGISVFTGVAMLFIFKATSDQDGIRRAKNLVKGHFLAIRLYKDEVSLMMNTMKNIILSNLLYMRKSLRPMLFLTLPVGFILVQLGSRYEYRPLRVGEASIVTLRVADRNIDPMLIELDLPAGLVSEIPAVRALEAGEISWRIRAQAPGDFQLLFKYADQEVSKTLFATDQLRPLAAEVASDNIGVKFMNPAEASLPAASFASLVSVEYPKRDFEMLGASMHWLVAFFVISLIAAFGLKGFVGVEV